MSKNRPPWIEIAGKSQALLNGILHEVIAQNGQSTASDYAQATVEDIRRSFVYRHARNIDDLMSDAIASAHEERHSSTNLIARTMLESVFKLVCAVKIESFAVEKIIWEAEDEVKRI